MRSAEETAILLALMFKNSQLNRIRISQKTLKLLAYRFRLRSAFVLSVTEALSSNYGLYLIELDTGSFGIIPAKSLEAAKTATARKYLPGIIKELKKGLALDFDELEQELLEEFNEFDDDGQEPEE